ncbi:MAG: hypothetical protein J2P37_32600 [Ktedonobacteraceae bacterium]|nr:hypothetical protein [Ktedonobacteraceae bacterium]
MQKKIIVRLYILSLLLSISPVATFVLIQLLFFRLPIIAGRGDLAQTVWIFSTILLLTAAIVLGMIAWIGALVKQGKQEQWVWFVCTLLFSGIVLLIYLIAVPERRTVQ